MQWKKKVVKEDSEVVYEKMTLINLQLWVLLE